MTLRLLSAPVSTWELLRRRLLLLKVPLSLFLQLLLTEGGKDGQDLAPKTVRNVHNIVHRALKDAVRWGYLLRNVAEAADPDAAVRASRMGKSAAWLLRGVSEGRLQHHAYQHSPPRWCCSALAASNSLTRAGGATAGTGRGWMGRSVP